MNSVNFCSSYPLTLRDRKLVGIIGIVEIIIGLVYVILGSFMLPICLITGKCGYSMAISAYAAWSGVVFSIAGAYGWECYKKPKQSSQVVSLLVWSVISAMLCGISFSLAVYDSQYYTYYLVADPSSENHLLIETSENKLKRAFSIALAILGIIEASLAIASSITCCRVYGCCQDSTEMVQSEIGPPAN